MKPFFSVGRMQICDFRRFRQNGPFLAGDKNTVYQKHGLCHPDIRGKRPELSWGQKKVPQRNCVTKILPNVRVNFLVRFASKPLFCWVMTGNPSNCSENSLVLFVRFFGFVGPFRLLTQCSKSGRHPKKYIVIRDAPEQFKSRYVYI